MNPAAMESSVVSSSLGPLNIRSCDMAPEGEPVGGIPLGDELNLLRGEVGDPAVQGQVHRGLFAHVVDESVGPRMAVPFHARSGRATR